MSYTPAAVSGFWKTNKATNNMKTLIQSTAPLFLAVAALAIASSSCVDRAGEPGSRFFGNPKTQSTETTGKKPSDGR